MSTLVILRHGQSTWNLEARFTGWVDVGLTEQGVREAVTAGTSLVAASIDPWIVHTSLLVRAIRTAELTLEAAGRSWIPVRRHWRLNERHYGDLQGKTHAEMTESDGADAVRTWRRSFAVRPPVLARDDPRHARFDPRYAGIAPEVLPATECLADVIDRMMPYYYDAIVPDLQAGPPVLVVAHGNSLRALVKHLEGISDDDIPNLEIPTGVPIVYTLDDELHVAAKAELNP